MESQGRADSLARLMAVQAQDSLTCESSLFFSLPLND